jgi:hypothetical protein
MIPCELMTDRMVPVAHGRSEWTAEQRAHIATCPACRAEWDLVATARRLGSPAGALDARSVGRAVVGRLARERRMRPWKRAGWIGALAAAAAIAIVVYRQAVPGGTTPGKRLAAAGAEFRLPLAELDSLNAGELTTVLEQMDAPLGASASPELPGLGDLQDTELERVLRSLEG